MPSKTKRLANARKKKSKTSATLKKLEAGELKLVDLLADPPSELRRVRLWTLLLRAPGLGEAGVTKVLKEAEVWPYLRVDYVLPGSMEKIIKALPQRARR